ncbi:MAG: acetate kinase [Oleiphilaceae bacterium]|nr:acetate kinase [Oleiphilaceae bacterium]
MDSTLLVVNSGSSSLKLALYRRHDFTPLASALAERLGSSDAALTVRTDEKHHRNLPPEAGHQQAIDRALALFRELGLLEGPPSAIGHRVVHGGEAFTRSVVIDDPVLEAIRQCTPLAPLHNPANLAGIEAMTALYPQQPQVAVFDTAFHQSLAQEAYLYALPYRLYREQGVRRYGFHGTSHRYMLSRTAAHLGQSPQNTSLISAHLGNGCSITAIRDGQSRDTSMGLTPLEGLVMGTRSGDLDPGLFDFFIQQGQSPESINRMLNRESGLLGLSGLSNDMRSLIEARDQGHEQAALAVSVFCYRLARYIGAMSVASGRPDALVFTGGIGENSAVVREETLSHLAHLGFAVDPDHNGDHGRRRQGEIQAEGSHRILVIATDEERVIAEDTAALTQDES